MKAHWLFVALHALSREIPVAAGASRLARPAEVASRVRRGLSVLRRPAHGCIISQENAQILLVQAPHALDRRTKPQVGFIAARPREPRLSRVTYPQVQFECQSCSLRFQRWYASPSKYKARLPPQERGLTLPSSGPAFGRPLKSNVRRLLSRSSSSSLKVRATQPSLAGSRCMQCFLFLSACRRARALRSGRSQSYKPISAGRWASRLRRIEATIEYARTVLHLSLSFGCAASLSFVARARSALIRACHVIEARERRFSSAA